MCIRALTILTTLLLLSGCAVPCACEAPPEQREYLTASIESCRSQKQFNPFLHRRVAESISYVEAQCSTYSRPPVNKAFIERTDSFTPNAENCSQLEQEVLAYVNDIETFRIDRLEVAERQQKKPKFCTRVGGLTVCEEK